MARRAKKGEAAAAEEALRAKEALAQAMQRKRLAIEDLRTTGKTSGWSGAAEVRFCCRAGQCAVPLGAGERSAGGGAGTHSFWRQGAGVDEISRTVTPPFGSSTTGRSPVAQRSWYSQPAFAVR